MKQRCINSFSGNLYDNKSNFNNNIQLNQEKYNNLNLGQFQNRYKNGQKKSLFEICKHTNEIQVTLSVQILNLEDFKEPEYNKLIENLNNFEQKIKAIHQAKYKIIF